MNYRFNLQCLSSLPLEEGFSLDELVIETKRMFETEGMAPMTATYSCPATADEVAEGKNELHVEGQIKDKSEGVRSAMMMLANKLATPIVRDTIVGTFGFDPSAEMQKMEIKTLKAGYVSSCKGRKLHGHYVFEQSASKFTFEKLADGNLNITSFTMDRGGLIVKETRTCKFVAKGHLGMKDGILDDVKVESDFTVLTLDVNTMKLSGVRANGNKAEVGTVVKDGETYNLDVTVDADYTAKDRTLKLK